MLPYHRAAKLPLAEFIVRKHCVFKCRVNDGVCNFHQASKVQDLQLLSHEYERTTR